MDVRVMAKMRAEGRYRTLLRPTAASVNGRLEDRDTGTRRAARAFAVSGYAASQYRSKSLLVM